MAAGGPVLRIVEGDATAEEVAALVAILASMQRPAEELLSPAVGRWSDPREMLAPAVVVGPGAWAASGRAPGVRTRAAW